MSERKTGPFAGKAIVVTGVGRAGQLGESVARAFLRVEADVDKCVVERAACP